eukprot:6239126-Prymnesium_polylepis.1
MRAHGAGAYSCTEVGQPEGANEMAPLGPEEKSPPPLSGPTDRAPGRAEWLLPVVRSNGDGWAILGEGRVRLPY